MVIFVPQSPNSEVDEEVKRIQDEIANRLGYTFPQEAKDFESRQEIMRGILSREKVLLLLDNLLHGVTFSSLGIPVASPAHAPAPPAPPAAAPTAAPSAPPAAARTAAPPAPPAEDPTAAPDNQPPICKVVFTARRKLTGIDIGAPVHEIELDLLDEEEARRFFKNKIWQHNPSSLTVREQRYTDESGETRSIEDIADEIADMCGGLPLALDEIGGHLQPKSLPEEWKTELERLGEPERASHGVPEGKVYASLRKAYDSLMDSHSEDNPSEKQSFLYCSVFPKGYAIELKELKRHWTVEETLGKVKRTKKLHVYFDRAVSISETLKRAHLLRSSSDCRSSVELHCQLHCMARWVAATEFGEKIFSQSNGNLDELSTMLEGHHKRISLMTCWGNLKKIDCPNLLTLIIRDSALGKIESDLFDSMHQTLKVLDLAACTLPGFQLNAVEMSNLQYLNLSHTDITSFPFDLNMLSKLKLLDLSFTKRLLIKSLEDLSALADLRLLNLYYCGRHGRSKQSQGVSASRLLKAVEKLNYLGDVALTIRGKLAFQRLENFSKLNLTHSMVITNCDDTSLNLQFIATAQKLEVLHVINCSARLHLPRDAINPRNCFAKLCNVEINGCWNLADLTWLKYAQALQSLKIANCPALTKVIDPGSHGNTQPDPPLFDKLTTLELIDLNELSSIFSQDLPFSSLESIIVHNCLNLQPIPMAENNDRETLPIIECQTGWWEGLGDDPRKSRLIPKLG